MSAQHIMRSHPCLTVIVTILAGAIQLYAKKPAREEQGTNWRADHRLIDLHQHITCTTQHLTRAVKIMDAAGIGIAVNLSGGTVTSRSTNAPSQFERNKSLADTLFPGRFLHYMSLDFSNWDEPGFSEGAVRQVEQGCRSGAAGLKEYKRLGLFLRDRAGDLIRVDDPKLDPVWQKCGELKMPVSIHVADPKAFWLPYDERNERWKELKDHKSWWFGDTNKYPPWKDLLESLNHVIARHPKTTFVCVHFGNNAEELEWVDQSLTRYPNMMVDLAARIPELGRHRPEKVRAFFTRHQDRILFATDFMVDQRLILGSSGNEPPPSDADAEVFFLKHWRWLETRDKDWAHMTPIQGDWKISSIGLPLPVLRKVYFDNARKLLARSMPFPTLDSRFISQDYKLHADTLHPAWETTTPGYLELETVHGQARPELTTTVRSLYSREFLYLRFQCPFEKLTAFKPALENGERIFMDQPDASLWERDVVEAFLAPDAENPSRYAEFEAAPTNERLDVFVNDGEKDFKWSSEFESVVSVDAKSGIWTCEMRIPFRPFVKVSPKTGIVWRANFYRCDRAQKGFLAWNPTLSGSFHVPQRFGWLKFVE